MGRIIEGMSCGLFGLMLYGTGLSLGPTGYMLSFLFLVSVDSVKTGECVFFLGGGGGGIVLFEWCFPALLLGQRRNSSRMLPPLEYQMKA